MSRVLEADLSSVSAWLVQYLVFDQRFMPIFCMLFGAGVVLLQERRGAEGFGKYMLIGFYRGASPLSAHLLNRMRRHVLRDHGSGTLGSSPPAWLGW